MSIATATPSKTVVQHATTKDALDHARAAAQELHGALSDAAAKRGGAIKADIEALPVKAEALATSIRTSVDAQNAATSKSLSLAVTYLGATGAHIAEALKGSGQAAANSIQRAIADARSSVQTITEAVAAKRAVAFDLKSSK